MTQLAAATTNVLPHDSDHNVSEYKDKERKNGEGNLRLGKPLQFREDMYSRCFVSQVK